MLMLDVKCNVCLSWLKQVLDDQTFAALQSVMLFNNLEILTKLQHDASFFPDLFKKLRATPPKVGCQDSTTRANREHQRKACH